MSLITPPTSVYDRLYTADVVLFALHTEKAYNKDPYNAAAFWASDSGHTLDLVGCFRNANLRLTFEDDNAFVPTDIFNGSYGIIQPVFKAGTWSLELDEVVDGTLDAKAFLKLAFSIPGGGPSVWEQEVHRGLVAVNVFRPGGGALIGISAAAGNTYAGVGFMTDATMKGGDGVMSQTATITSYGPLAVALSGTAG